VRLGRLAAAVVAALGLIASGPPLAGVSAVTTTGAAQAPQGKAGQGSTGRASARSPSLKVAERRAGVRFTPGGRPDFRRSALRADSAFHRVSAGGGLATPERPRPAFLQPGHARTAGGAAPAAPSLLEGFQGEAQDQAIGTYGSDQAVAPPDANLAVGADAVVEATNSALYFSQRDGTPAGSVDINALVRTPVGWESSDPRVVYDPVAGRFYFSVLVFDPSSCANNVLLLRTDTGDPTSTWNGFVLRQIGTGPQGQPAVMDQPALGFSDNLVAVSWNYFDCANTSILYGSQVDMVQKSDLLSVNAAPHSAVAFEGGPPSPQPVVSLGSTTVQYVIWNNSDPLTVGSSANSAIGVFPFTGTPEQQNMPVPQPTFEAINPTSVDGTTGLIKSAPQSGTSQLLITDDDRLLNAVWEAGVIWTAGSTDCQPSGDSTVRACLNVVSINASAGGSVTGRQQVSPFLGVNGAYLYYPAISVDSSGTAYVVFDESSSSSFESVMVAGVFGTTVSSFTALHSSSAYYDPNDPGVCFSVGCRWGDYSGAAQDPSHPTDVWVVSEDMDNNTAHCASHVCWNSYIGRYTYSAPSITSLAPAAGPVSGAQSVTVNGSDFLPGTAATLGGTAVTPQDLTPDSFTITTPAHAAGYVFAVATDTLGNSGAGNANAGYEYVGLASYFPLSPVRLLDTRPTSCIQCGSGPLTQGESRVVPITGVNGLPSGTDPVPSSATAVVLNVTAVAGNSGSYFTLWPNGTAHPTASSINFNVATNTANLVTVTLGQSGAADTQREIEIFNSLGTANVLLDVEGYFAPQGAGNAAGEFHATPPSRVCDTRAGAQPANVCNQGHATDNLLAPNQVLKVDVTATGGSPIPGDGTASAAVLNLTAVAGTSGTYMSVFPTQSDGSCAYGGTNPPAPTSSINVSVSTNQANRVIVPLGPAATGLPDTDVCVYNSLGNINFILDANGWFGSSSSSPPTPLGKQFQPIGPSRVCDTRPAQPLPCAGHTLTPNSFLNVPIAGVGGIPSSGPVAVIANVVAVFGTSGTYIEAYPADAPQRPIASDINVNAFENLANMVVVELSSTPPSGEVSVYNSLGTIDVVIDVGGWFQ
jgi:IPT/TIG domain